MAKVDLHVHSIYSEHPSEWFLQRLGAGESYTEPDFIYENMKNKGMDFVTITDHNNIEGALLLQQKYPGEIIIGDEATAYFPEDEFKVHVLLYGLNEKQFVEIQRIRTNIYDLRDYIKEEDLAYSIAHATFSVNGKLKYEHLEKLLLMFDIFEGINGGRNEMHNLTWMNVLENLKEQHIEQMYEKHNIEPMSETPWIKGLTAGSDDHSGLFLGETYTEGDASTTQEFLQQLKHKNTQPVGRHNDYKSFVFMVYKVAYDYSRSKSSSFSQSLLSQINNLVFTNKSLNWKNRLKMKAYSTVDKNGKDAELKSAFNDLVETLQKEKDKSLDEKISVAYRKIATISDEFLKLLFASIEKHLMQGDVFKLIQNFTSSISGIFLMLPFFSSLRHMFANRDLILKLRNNFNLESSKKEKNILWFSDTIEDLNGVSVTVNRIRENATKSKRNVYLVGSVKEEKYWKNFINIPSIHTFNLPYYEYLKINIPSILKSMEKISKFNPDLIIISTPASIGLLGLLAARLLNVKCIGIYHTDFAKQIEEMNVDTSLSATVRSFVNWFYQLVDEIRVPTYAYMDMLESQGFDRTKMKHFARGVDTSVFYPQIKGREWLQKTYNIEEGFYFLYTGRVSFDKSLEVALNAFDELHKENPDTYFFVVGSGPDIDIFKKDFSHNDHIIFTGKKDREILPNYYSAADLFVFPSKTDTFGMVVVEAQACGLIAFVSNEGGPQEVIKDGESGYILREVTVDYWRRRMLDFMKLCDNEPEKVRQMSKRAVDLSKKRGGWNKLIESFVS
ncbi:MAG: glycosyltransferase [Candidatus Cloacimonetes bacterium]|nr:glycosyltransferase [Candidatus Cloacimonadota bacterium]